MLETTDYMPEGTPPTSQATPDAAVVARSLRRTFKGGIEAVRDLDLTVSSGEGFGFLGPNGAGKTTTVRMLCTLLPPTAGTASVAGLDVVQDAAEIRRRIGVALQEIGLDPVQTGRELLELQCGLYGITGRRGRGLAQWRRPDGDRGGARGASRPRARRRRAWRAGPLCGGRGELDRRDRAAPRPRSARGGGD